MLYATRQVGCRTRDRVATRASPAFLVALISRVPLQGNAEPPSASSTVACTSELGVVRKTNTAKSMSEISPDSVQVVIVQKAQVTLYEELIAVVHKGR